MSISLRSMSVNVSRVDLLAALKHGQSLHEASYKEAKEDYQKAVVKFLRDALARAEAGDTKDVTLKIRPPENHAAEYQDAIEMFTVSVDETIQLDREAYKAYYRNEWPWSQNFALESALYKSIISG